MGRTHFEPTCIPEDGKITMTHIVAITNLASTFKQHRASSFENFYCLRIESVRFVDIFSCIKCVDSINIWIYPKIPVIVMRAGT